MSGPYCETCEHFQAYALGGDGSGNCTSQSFAITDRAGNRANEEPEVHAKYTCSNHAPAVEFCALVDLLSDEGELRKKFEGYIKSLSAVIYSLERNEHQEYRVPAVYHMWTGFCIAAMSGAKTN